MHIILHTVVLKLWSALTYDKESFILSLMIKASVEEYAVFIKIEVWLRVASANRLVAAETGAVSQILFRGRYFK